MDGDKAMDATAVVPDVMRRLMEAGLATPSTVQGCSEQEIAGIEHELGVTLPRTYRLFLRMMGRAAGTFFRGTDFLLAALPTLREAAEHLLDENDIAMKLDPADFVFAMHQGYTFLFFRCGVSDDPPVFLYAEDETSFRQVADHFTSWLIGAAQDEIGLEAELKE